MQYPAMLVCHVIGANEEVECHVHVTSVQALQLLHRFSVITLPIC